jgi:toxin ParE1/3/4
MHTKWTRKALLNIDTILTYISLDNPERAREFVRDITIQLRILEEFPLVGRAGKVMGTREFVVHENYIIYYRVYAECIEILRVLHTRQKYP